MQSEGAQDGLHDDRRGGPDIEVGPENTFGDAALDDVAEQVVQRGEHPGVVAGPGFGEVLVVEIHRPIQAVLRARLGFRADSVDDQLDRGGAVQSGRLGAPDLRRLRHRPLQQGDQQFVLAAEVLVEGPQRGLGAGHHFLHGEVGAPCLAQNLDRGLDEAGVPSRRFGFVVAGHAASSIPRSMRCENEVTASEPSGNAVPTLIGAAAARSAADRGAGIRAAEDGETAAEERA